MSGGGVELGGSGGGPVAAPAADIGGLALGGGGIPINDQMTLEVRARHLVAAQWITIDMISITPAGRVITTREALRSVDQAGGGVYRLRLWDGVLVSVGVAMPDDAGPLDSCRCRVSLIMPSGVLDVPTVLLDAQVSQWHPICWPYSAELAIPASGVLLFVQGTNPAAGVDPFVSLGLNGWWKVLHVEATLTTSATVADREPQLYAAPDGVNGPVITPGAVTQAASLTQNWTWQRNQGYSAAITGHVVQPLLQDDLWLPPAAKLVMATAAKQAGDDWSELSAWVLGVPDLGLDPPI